MNATNANIKGNMNTHLNLIHLTRKKPEKFSESEIYFLLQQISLPLHPFN